MPVKGIFFDLYGTLLNYDDLKLAWRDWLHSLYEEFAQSGMELSLSDFSDSCKRFYDDLTFYELQKSDHLTVFEQRIDRFADKLGVSLSDIHATADNCAGAWQRHISFDSQAEPLLRGLKKDRTIVLVSNFDHPRHVRRLLEQNGWLTLFDHVVISAEVGVQKPDPRIFKHALEVTSLSPKEVMHVGDSYTDDVLGAYEAGIVPVFIVKDGHNETAQGNACRKADNRMDPGLTLPPGTHRIESLNELADICRKL